MTLTIELDAKPLNRYSTTALTVATGEKRSPTFSAWCNVLICCDSFNCGNTVGSTHLYDAPKCGQSHKSKIFTHNYVMLKSTESTLMHSGYTKFRNHFELMGNLFRFAFSNCSLNIELGQFYDDVNVGIEHEFAINFHNNCVTELWARKV